MKKQLLSLLLIAFLIQSVNTNAQPLNISLYSTNLCIGSHAWASVSPTIGTATSYSWSVTSNSCTATFTPGTNGEAILVNYPCCGSFVIACTAFNGTVAIISGSIVANVGCLPATTPTITPNNITMCSTASNTLIGNGCVTYTWSNGSIGPTMLVNNPLASFCASVMGMSANGCVSMSSNCLSVTPAPLLSISGNTPPCLGSSVTLTVSGAINYTWMANNTNATTLNVLPLNLSPVTNSVSGTNSLGCVGTATYMVMPTGSCAIVWPGDANRDGSVSNLDVLELGLAAASTGAARTTTGNAWAGAYATAWTGSISTGWNKVHADCNGDGIVNSSDNTAITQNFALTHSFKEAGASAANPEISLVPAQLNAYAGIWNKADIVLGDASNSINQLYGVAFDITYDMNMVQPDSVKILFTPSFFNTGNQNIDFGKTIYTNGKLYAATVRVDHNNVNGNGKIGEFWYKEKSGLPSNAVINLSVVNAQKVSSSAAFNTLSTAPSQSLAISANVVNLFNNVDFEKMISLFPNPSNNMLNLRSDLGTSIRYSIYDITGRLILSGDFLQAKTLEVKNLAKGAYFINFQCNGQSCTKQLLIEN